MDEAQFMEIARRRFRDVNTYESENREEALEDRMMINNKNHWPEDLKREREAEGRPCLTANVLPSFVDNVIGDIRSSEISIQVLPYGNGATKDLADTYNGITRKLQLSGQAEIARDGATEDAAMSGFGYYRIITDYDDDNVFKTTLKTQRIDNPFTVYADWRNIDPVGRDREFYFITNKIPKEEYEQKYGDEIPSNFMTGIGDRKLWIEQNDVIVAEYWVKMPIKKTILLMDNNQVWEKVKWDRIKDDLKAKEEVWHTEPGPDGNVPVRGPAPIGSGYHEEIVNKAPEVVQEREIDSHVVVQ